MRKSKILVVIMAFVMLFAFSACGDKSVTDPTEPAKIIEKESNTSPKMKGSKINFGTFEVEYLDYELAKDEDGKDAVVLNYNFTNNGEASTSFNYDIIESVFQDGVELDEAYVYESDDAIESLSDDVYTKIQPGKSIKVKTTYVLNNTEAPVEVEMSSFDLYDPVKFTVELKK